MSEPLVRDWKLMYIGRLLSVFLNILDCNVFMQLILFLSICHTAELILVANVSQCMVHKYTLYTIT